MDRNFSLEYKKVCNVRFLEGEDYDLLGHLYTGLEAVCGNISNYLGTQTFAGRTAPKSNIDQQFVSERGQHKILQRMLQENLWRLLCFHKWGKYLPNFWLLLLLLLCVDLISIIRTKK